MERGTQLRAEQAKDAGVWVTWKEFKQTMCQGYPFSSALTERLKQSAGPHSVRQQQAGRAFGDECKPKITVLFQKELRQEMLQQKKFARTLMMDKDKSCLSSTTFVNLVVEEESSSLQPHKPAAPPPGNALQSGQHRRLKVVSVQQDLQGDSKSTGHAMKLPDKLPKPESGREGSKLPGSVHVDAASARKPRFPGDQEFRAVSEDQSLQEAVKTQVTEALEGVKVLDPSATALSRASFKIGQRLLGNSDRTEPSEISSFNPEQEIALLARKVVASVLHNVGKPLKSNRKEALTKHPHRLPLTKPSEKLLVVPAICCNPL